MSEPDRSPAKAAAGEADRTLLGVAPPRIESSAESPLRSPVLVRSGTSVADLESAAAPRAALPTPLSARMPPHESAPGTQRDTPGPADGQGLARALGVARRRPVLWMILAPLLISGSAAAVLHSAASSRPVAPRGTFAVSASPLPDPGSARPAASSEPAGPVALAMLEARPVESLSAAELLRVAEGASERKRAAARAMRERVEANPALGKDPALRNELVQLASDERTAPEALAALAALETPMAADLLYEVWTGTLVRTDATELARALLYSKDLRAKASPALSVALDLRRAEDCEQTKAILPEALKDGDRRSLHLLGKLTSKRGCGPKKSADCYACLRSLGDELSATISAVKSRRAPSYSLP